MNILFKHKQRPNTVLTGAYRCLQVLTGAYRCLQVLTLCLLSSSAFAGLTEGVDFNWNIVGNDAIIDFNGKFFEIPVGAADLHANSVSEAGDFFIIDNVVGVTTFLPLHALDSGLNDDDPTYFDDQGYALGTSLPREFVATTGGIVESITVGGKVFGLRLEDLIPSHPDGLINPGAKFTVRFADSGGSEFGWSSCGGSIDICPGDLQTEAVPGQHLGTHYGTLAGLIGLTFGAHWLNRRRQHTSTTDA